MNKQTRLTRNIKRGLDFGQNDKLRLWAYELGEPLVAQWPLTLVKSSYSQPEQRPLARSLAHSRE